ncbi:putative membrane protein [Paenibacillus shirakamiensis]|uniref:Membrane protein n=1 Tax=Paenibacillus shirakamiensis TaxID=1265935 RepID=A0ABS4JM30_9BACL|nr:hypothetical protein [Paenibacillus shirakamiensis]MBP2001644.1 putative membrane protein [Paenibacillus shirakamiensis]
MSPFKSSTGLPENLAGFLCYLVPFVGGAVFLALEKRSRYVMFHALQSLIVFGILILGHVASGFIPLLGSLIALLLQLIGVILWIVLMTAALQGKWYKVPYFGDAAESQMRRL